MEQVHNKDSNAEVTVLILVSVFPRAAIPDNRECHSLYSIPGILMPPSVYSASSSLWHVLCPPSFLSTQARCQLFFSGAFPAPLSLNLIFTLLKRSHLVKLKLTDSKRPPLPWKSILPISCTISGEVKETETAQGTGKGWVSLLTHL